MATQTDDSSADQAGLASIHPRVDEASPAPNKPKVSIIIKTLNEERHVARAIESALAALSNLDGEVIVADSLSTDRTVEIAMHYKVIVAQLCQPSERCCGIGPQLGFQHAHGDFIYILDGDMELDPGFIDEAVLFLQENTDVAGVAGLVEELGGGNYEFESRKTDHEIVATSGVQPWLDMGGLYRREAVDRTGYLSNRNLHACEEQELGMRLVRGGGRLLRLPIPGVRHYGHTVSSWELMKRRLRSRYSDGPGELVRSALGTDYLASALQVHIKLLVMAVILSGMFVGLAVLPWTAWPLLLFGSAFIVLSLLMLMKKRSPTLTMLGMTNWVMRSLGFARGLLRKQKDPKQPIASRLLVAPVPSAHDMGHR